MGFIFDWISSYQRLSIDIASSVIRQSTVFLINLPRFLLCCFVFFLTSFFFVLRYLWLQYAVCHLPLNERWDLVEGCGCPVIYTQVIRVSDILRGVHSLGAHQKFPLVAHFNVFVVFKQSSTCDTEIFFSLALNFISKRFESRWQLHLPFMGNFLWDLSQI